MKKRKDRPYILPCSFFGGVNPKTFKKVGSRHRWTGAKWGKGECLYCHRAIEQVRGERGNHGIKQAQDDGQNPTQEP
jgi:hypothetical protein